MANHISHASLPYPVKGCRFTILVPYLDADGDPTDPTTPDTERSIDAASFADCTEEATTITGSNGMAYITLTGDEMNGSAIAVAAKVASGPKNTLATLYPRTLPIVQSGTAQAGAAGTITLSTGALQIDDFYNGCIVRTTGGTGGGGGSGSLGNQARVITDYVGSTRVATISPSWETNPSTDTTYEVLRTEMANFSLADLRVAAADTITASALAADAVTEIWAAGTRTLTAIDEDSTTLDLDATIRAALGMAAADLDTQLTNIDNFVDDLETRVGTPSNFGSGATVAANLVDLETLVDDLEARIGTPANLGGGATIAQNLSDIEAQTDDIGAAGAGLTAIPTIAAVTTVTNLTNAPTAGDLTATMKASVNAEVLDVLNTDTFAEPGQGNPPATATLVQKIGYLYKAWRNRSTVTSSEYALYADNGTTKDQEAAVSDDGTTFERAEIQTGA